MAVVVKELELEETAGVWWCLATVGLRALAVPQEAEHQVLVAEAAAAGSGQAQPLRQLERALPLSYPRQQKQ